MTKGGNSSSNLLRTFTYPTLGLVWPRLFCIQDKLRIFKEAFLTKKSSLYAMKTLLDLTN